MVATAFEPYLAALFGAAGGIVLGLAARLGRFCTLGAIEDCLYGGSDHRLRMLGVAIGTGILATFVLAGLGFVDLQSSVYLTSDWNPAAHVVGGLLFGVGMALAGNCGFGALARLGGGDLRSFVIVLVLGVSAYVVMSGPLAPVRLLLFPPDLVTSHGTSGYARLLSGLTRLPETAIGALVGLAILAVVLAPAGFRARRAMVAWSVAVGLAISFGWAASSCLNDLTFDAVAVQSYTFAAPIGESLLYAMTASGSTLSFAVGGVAGVWVGAFLGSLMKGHFRWEACEDPRELRRQIFGAVLMGGGAVIATGCTIGQGISAMSVLSFGAPLTAAGIFIGASLGLKTMIAGFHPV